MKLNIIITAFIVGLVALAGNVTLAQEKGAQGLTSQQAVTVENTNHIGKVLPSQTDRRSSVTGGSSTVNFNLKSRGFVGRYEVVNVRERGLFGPSTVATFIYDPTNDVIAVVQSSSSPGLGVAIVNGAAQAGSSFLFGSNLKPNREIISNSGAVSAKSEGGIGIGFGGNSSSTGASGPVAATASKPAASPPVSAVDSGGLSPSVNPN